MLIVGSIPSVYIFLLFAFLLFCAIWSTIPEAPYSTIAIALVTFLLFMIYYLLIDYVYVEGQPVS